jgi:hypothetical protein
MSTARWHVRAVGGFALLSLGIAGCATTAAKSTPAAKPIDPAAGGPMVEKTREELQVAPWEIALSGVRGEGETTESVTAKNLLDRPVTVASVNVLGDAAPLFAVKSAPVFPATIPAHGTLSVELSFRPPSDAEAGLKRAVLRFQTGSERDDGPATDLSALVLQGREVDAEPPLQQIVETLGYAIDVGGKELQLPEAGGADQVAASLFERARPGPVAVNPVARFSEDGALGYGYYLPGTSLKQVDTRQLGVLSAGQHQTLNPSLEPDAITSFDPGTGRFGIWMGTPEKLTFSENRRNRGEQRSLARVFPLRARGGAKIPDAYLVAFGTAARNDFQDGVFVLWNVKIAEAKPSAATAPIPAP